MSEVKDIDTKTVARVLESTGPVCLDLMDHLEISSTQHDNDTLPEIQGCTHYPMRHFVVSGKVTDLTQLENAFSISIKTGIGVVNTLQFAGADLCDLPKWLKVGVGVEFDSMTNTIKKNSG